MHRIIKRSAVVAVIAAFVVAAAGCKSSSSRPSESTSPSTGSPSPPTASQTPVPPTLPPQSAPSAPSSKPSPSQSSQPSETTAQNDSDSDASSEDDSEGEGTEQSAADQTNQDRELAEIGESVARAAEAVTRASEALAKAREKMAERSREHQEQEGEGEDAEVADEGAASSSESDPNYDPFAEPSGGSSAAAAAAAAVAAAAQSVMEAQAALEAESQAAQDAAASEQQSRSERRESAEQREREAQSAEDLADSAERLEAASADINNGEAPKIKIETPAEQTAREALTKAAQDLMEARNKLIKAAVELGYLPEELSEPTPGSQVVFQDMETMVEFLEKSVELLATVIDLGGLPDFSSPEYDDAREAMARRGRTGSRRSSSGEAASAGAPRRSVADLEGELNRTLGDFDNTISNSRRSGRQGDGQVSTIEGGVEGQGDPGGGSREIMGNTTVRTEAGTTDPDSQSGQSVGSNQRGNAPQVPDDLPDPQGDDVVARQLREAAMAESNPELRARLWEEYRSYREATGN
ncbi:MAG: hypothetical protein AAF465_14075 [Pseudomonadota bacterium]